jgi:hypothetical protein
VFCPSCLAKVPQGPDFANSIAQWMLLPKPVPIVWEEVVEGNNGLGNEPEHEGTLYFTAGSNCLGRGPHVRDKNAEVEAWNRRVDG